MEARYPGRHYAPCMIGVTEGVDHAGERLPCRGAHQERDHAAHDQELPIATPDNCELPLAIVSRALPTLP